MSALLAEWGTAIIYSLISAAILGFAKYQVSKARKERDEAKANAAKLEEQKLEATIDRHLEPIQQDLEDLREYCRQTELTEKSHIKLIVASYRYRLVQLCKGFLAQGYITAAQMEQLDEFYKLYTGLGGNGQAKLYYEKAIGLPTKEHDQQK